MKFLESKEISNEQDGVSIVFAPVSPLNQAALLGYQNKMSRALKVDDIPAVVQAKMQSVFYALDNMINKLTIKGEDYPPGVVAASADLSDPDTMEAINTIFDMVVSLLVQGETKKKSSKPPKSTKKGKGAKDAQDPTKA
jgi:hypothetical protein